MHLKDSDIKYITDKGLTLDQVESQLQILKKGVPFSNIKEAATLNNGIIVLTPEHQELYLSSYSEKIQGKSVIKFVPASGAATRMFKFLYRFLDEFNPNEQSLNFYINKNKAKDLSLFLVGLEKFPFYNAVIEKLQEKLKYEEQLSAGHYAHAFVETMLSNDGLDFGNSPKGLIPFHKYKDGSIATAFEEHLFESALYSADSKMIKLHFTISERFKDKFKDEFKRIQKKVEAITECEFNIGYSFQHESTDTIAVKVTNEPMRNADGSLHFRPSGHGALLKNLNDLDNDIIFIKNIDNVVVKHYKNEIAKYKKVLAGYLLTIQEHIFDFLKQLDDTDISESDIITIAEFLERQLNVRITEEFEKYSNEYKIEYLRDKLNRPLRVCGMVKNEGEPGGGPFWVRNQSWVESLQIVESAQINIKDKQQRKILKNATHFNPVDLVCGIKDYKGNKFDLQQFVDHKASFVTMKTKTGKDIKALELPGLWNGSMAHWNTIFIEVPLITFSPVKTVNDLLKPPHQIR
ncbi:DUF4301 family protein [Winogradskyella maritima]|uniref:DUF4301 family protein n=1 Tax=Winogradskyella maritima TaxID=1517766 RepID=A0ABV8AF37_9FLAO|nr:DUF4301 family protein [Winogradskyella maritima]